MIAKNQARTEADADSHSNHVQKAHERELRPSWLAAAAHQDCEDGYLECKDVCCAHKHDLVNCNSDVKLEKVSRRARLPEFVWPMDESNLAAGLILACGFVVISVQLGVILSMGVYFVAIREHFNCSRKEAATVSAVLYGFVLMMGPLSALMYKRFGCRPCVMNGGLLACLGFVLSYFASDLFVLCCTFSIVGIGLGICGMATFAVQAEYFTTYRFFATAFLTVGGSVGSFLFAPFFLLILDAYGLHGSMLINAGVVLNLVVIGSLMKSKSSLKASRSKGYLELSLFKDVSFLLLWLNSFMWGGYVSSYFNLVVELMHEQCITLRESSHILMLSAIIGLFARVLSSCLSQARFTNLPLFYTISTIFSGVGLLAIIPCESFHCFASTASVVVIGLGLMIPIHSPLSIFMFGAERFPIVGGYTSFAIGFGGLLLPFMAGSVGDSLNSTKASFYFIVASCAAASVFAAAITLWQAGTQRRTVVIQEDKGDII